MIKVTSISFRLPIASLLQHSKLVQFAIVIALVSMLVTVCLPSYNATGQEQQQIPRLYVAGAQSTTSPTTLIPANSLPHEIFIKTIRISNGEPENNPDFKIDRSNVISVPFGQNINIFSDAADQQFSISGVRLTTDNNGQTFNLNRAASTTNMFSLAGHTEGVYILDVLGTMGSMQGTYETLLQILPQEDGSDNGEEEQTKDAIDRRTAELIITISVTDSESEPEDIPEERYESPYDEDSVPESLEEETEREEEEEEREEAEEGFEETFSSGDDNGESNDDSGEGQEDSGDNSGNDEGDSGGDEGSVD